MKSSIPARIIQTGKSRELPLAARASAAGLKALNPGFEYLYFDDADVVAFVRKEFPEHLEIFENFPYRIQKYDFFRYLAIYRLGGFYFDLDMFMAAGLEELLPRSCVFPFEQLTMNQCLRRQYALDWEIGNYAFAAAAGHPFLGAVIANCVRAQRDPAWVEPMMQGIPRPLRADFYVLNTTGPGQLTRTLAENPALASAVSVLFPRDVCDPATWHQFGDFGVHKMEGSWRTHGSYLRRRLANWWEAWTMGRLLQESRRHGQTRPSPMAARAAATPAPTP